MSSNLFSTREPQSLQGFKYQTLLLKLGPGVPLQSQDGKGKGRSICSFSINHQINPGGILQLWVESKRRSLFVFIRTKAKSIILNHGSGRLTDRRVDIQRTVCIFGLEKLSHACHSLLSVNSVCISEFSLDTVFNIFYTICNIFKSGLLCRLYVKKSVSPSFLKHSLFFTYNVNIN